MSRVLFIAYSRQWRAPQFRRTRRLFVTFFCATENGRQLFPRIAERHPQPGCGSSQAQPRGCLMYGSDRLEPPRGPYSKLYAKLGVSPDASAEDIELAYKVLEQTYRPGGAYLDDVMHLAFTEIANAAAILRNPRTRKAYDQGYIDERGRRTKAGMARAARIRTIAFGSAFLLAGLAGVMIMSSGVVTPINRASEGADSLKKETQATPQVKITPQSQAIEPASPPRPQEQASKPDVKPPGGSPAVHADDRDYLPPQAAFGPSAPAGDRPVGHVRPTGKRYASLPRKSAAAPQPRQDQPNAPRPEQRRLTCLSKPSKPAQQDVQSYIWFGWPPHQPLRISESLRSAHCLACLTNHSADCSAACR